MTPYVFEAIGTKWQVDIEEELGDARAAGLFSRIRERIEAFDAVYSRFRADSIVTRMSKAEGSYTLPSDAVPMLSLYRDLYERTGGLFTPLVGDMLSDAGYDAEYTLRQKKELDVAPAWDEIFEFAGSEIVMRKPALFDFGAAGKGYLVDLVAELIEAETAFGYTIDAGGDIVHKGASPIRVGLEDPENAAQAVGVCVLASGSICGSAGNRRAWGEYTHIIDPKKRSSPRGISAVWVTAESGLLADALATCLFFVPPETLTNAYDFQYVILKSDRSVEVSDGFSGEVFVSA